MNKNIRLIARLDIKGPNVIKGIQFDGHRVLGLPTHFACHYYEEGVDELIFQDTVASLYQRNSCLEIIRETAENVFIPLTVAGGIRSLDDIHEVLRAGADKVAINTAAIENPEFIRDAIRNFGSQCIVLSVEAHRIAHEKYEIWTNYGRERSGLDALEWARRMVDIGVGEVLLTSVDREGTGKGYDLELTRMFSDSLPVPVIASGGAGSKEDLVRAVLTGNADAVCAASIFHYHYYEQFDHDVLQEKYKLRMGKKIDTGNLDFIHFGYGGFRSIPVKPTPIGDAKLHLQQAGLNIRQIQETRR